MAFLLSSNLSVARDFNVCFFWSVAYSTQRRMIACRCYGYDQSVEYFIRITITIYSWQTILSIYSNNNTNDRLFAFNLVRANKLVSTTNVSLYFTSNAQICRNKSWTLYLVWICNYVSNLMSSLVADAFKSSRPFVETRESSQGKNDRSDPVNPLENSVLHFSKRFSDQ